MKYKCHLFFQTLGTKLKIDIIFKLKEKPLGVVELAKELNQERSKVSHALLFLSDCDFVKVRPSGKKRIYSLNDDTILPLLDLVEKHMKKHCKTCKKKIKNKG